MLESFTRGAKSMSTEPEVKRRTAKPKKSYQGSGFGRTGSWDDSQRACSGVAERNG